jgi:5-methylcytosine-specific restriction endonuclease McrA
MLTDYEITKRYQEKQTAKGLCVNGCGRKLKTSRHCSECAEKASKNTISRRNEQRLKFINQGLCSEGCGRPLVLKWTCRQCADKINRYSRQCRLNNIDKYKKVALKGSHHRRFGGLREQVIERDNKSCQICGYSSSIVVHHINENPKDNRIENLITICRICHTVVERMNRTRPNLLHLFPWFKTS